MRKKNKTGSYKQWVSPRKNVATVHICQIMAYESHYNEYVSVKIQVMWVFALIVRVY